MRLPTPTRRHGAHAITAARSLNTFASKDHFNPPLNAANSTHWTVHDLGVNLLPGGPAEDLSGSRIAELTAEVERLRAELHDMQVQVDDLLDRESMFAGAECMERLTTAAAFERFGAPRARHLSVCPAVDATAPGSVVA
ncbi:hypothetical protein [Nocardia sp. IFM 10818]